MRCRDSEAAAIDCWSANGFETEGRNEGRVVAGGNDFNGLMVFHSPPDTIFYFLGVCYESRESSQTENHLLTSIISYTLFDISVLAQLAVV